MCLLSSLKPPIIKASSVDFECVLVVRVHSTFSPEERAFLLSATKTGKLATVRADGRPHIVPVAFDLDNNTIVLQAKHTSVKARNMQRDPRVCLCVDVETFPYAYPDRGNRRDERRPLRFSLLGQAHCEQI